jgi:hypothetical protein
MNMKDETISLSDRIDEMFMEMDSQIVMTLRENDEEYAALAHEKNEIEIRFSEIEQWLEGTGPLSLTDEEHAGLARYTALTTEMEDLERRAIYYAGHRDCAAWLKKIGAL